MGETRTRVIQGARKGEGICGYALEFYEPFDRATPKHGWLAAVDPSTCRFEFQIGIIVDSARPSGEGGRSDGGEAQAKEGATSALLPTGAIGYANPAAFEGLGAAPETIPALSHRNRKMVITGKWQDPEPFPSIEVTKALLAIRSETNDNTV